MLQANAMLDSGSEGSMSPARSNASIQSDIMSDVKTSIDNDASKMPPPAVPGSPAAKPGGTSTLGTFKCCSDVYVVLWCRASV